LFGDVDAEFFERADGEFARGEAVDGADPAESTRNWV
jgi:hypothetical protein